MASDRYTSSASHADSDKSSSNKRSHTYKTPVSVTASPQLQKQGISKKPSILNRSASAERGAMTPFPWLAGSGGSGNNQVMPSQPIVQDPSMPLLTPPNPTTQLEEAKRRLENNEGKRRPEEQQARPLPVKSNRKSSKRPSGSSTVPATPGGPEETVIGYFFCGEPIPYRHTLPGKVVTLAQFKKLITRIGSYRLLCTPPLSLSLWKVGTDHNYTDKQNKWPTMSLP
ncbi:AXIN1 [Acanthosepion pharaonis]|uniref:AXIN1 n=1 Tax=Acanthosepion pharaonis TaxID=158019 RepID=A0A812APR9_ACAPH|nr:AXIN1 [Sepia pharaonis]